MKICKVCGHVELSNYEYIILEALPADAKELAELLGTSIHSINGILRKLRENYFVDREEEINKSGRKYIYKNTSRRY